MNKIKRTIVLVVMLALLVSAFSVCLVACDKGDDDVNPNLDLSKPVTIKIAGSKPTWSAMDAIITLFEDKYSNCTVVYESLQDYENSIVSRMASSEDKIDIFMSRNIVPTDSKYGALVIPNAFNLLSRPDVLDLSNTNQGIVGNYKSTTLENTQYCIPYGGEVRGLYVNKTILNQYDLEVPKNRTQFLECCRVLKANGYLPLHGASSALGQQLLYPYICNSIVQNETFDKVNTIDGNVAEDFRDAYAFMYELVEKGYCNDTLAKTIEIGTNSDTGKASVLGSYSNADGKARTFLNVYPDTNTTYAKKDDIGQIPFIVDTLSFKASLDIAKDDYSSDIDYEFILAPVGEEDYGYAYLSPANGLCLNKNSDNIEWALEFLDFFYKADNLKTFAEYEGCIPVINNATEALEEFNAPANHISNVGQVTFDYAFYATITMLLRDGYSYTYTDEQVDAAYLAAHTYTVTDGKYKFSAKDGPNDFIGMGLLNGAKYLNADGSLRYTLDEYMARLNAEFDKVKATL